MLPSIPPLLHQSLSLTLAPLHPHLSSDATAPLPTAVRDTLEPVFAISPFVASQCLKHPDRLLELAGSGRLCTPQKPHEYQAALDALASACQSEAEWMCVLRRYRNIEMVRIAWRDITGWATLEQTLMELSLLAEACIDTSLRFVFDQATAGRAVPLNAAGQPQSLVVLGMGKLGAHELNFSSDIDLIFAYRDEGVLTDKKATSFAEFYARLARSLVKVLGTITEDGFVFRVDTRLRPFGDSGPLVMNFDGMENYYQGQAREWERYAMVKARVVAGDREAGMALDQIIKPFVYRRYLDYRALGELRGLKQKITSELVRRDRLDNVKLGPGGIREIEFIGQAFQLIRGGQEPRLRVRGILEVLSTLGELGLLPAAVVSLLQEAYCFLRRVENRIQQYADQQTHDLPTDPPRQLALAYALHYPDWASFRLAFDQVRHDVHGVFQTVIEAGKGEEQNSFSLSEDAATNLPPLQALNWPQAEQTADFLARFANSPAMRHATPRGQTEVNRILPALLRLLTGSKNPVASLERLLALLEAVASRTVYLSLLAENPAVLSQLVTLADGSLWIIHYIARHPLLLDELLDDRRLYSPLTRDALQQELAQKLAAFDPDDTEQILIALRQFKQAHVLRVAAADLMGAIPIMRVSDALTAIAEVLVATVLALAWQTTTARYGIPPGTTADTPGDFGVIAYGKLGGMELGYGSDLDLVFLYTGDASEATQGARSVSRAEFFARLGKSIIHLLTANTPAGTLYDLDLRLRPSGASGLLVSTLEAYATYQMEQAWTWEQQALVKARFVAGDAGVGRSFSDIRHDALTRRRDREALRHDVLTMREKMRASLISETPGSFPLKQGVGGIVDVEFLVQFGVLSEACDHPELTTWTDVVRLLEDLSRVGFLSPDDAGFLKHAYCTLRERVHRAALQEAASEVPNTEYQALRTRVRQLWWQHMVCEVAPPFTF